MTKSRRHFVNATCGLRAFTPSGCQDQEANLAAAQEVAKVIQRPSPRLVSGSMSEFRGIVLQKSKVAEPRIFRENTKQERVVDSCTLNRVIEVACEFNAR